MNKQKMMANFDALNTSGLSKSSCLDVALKAESSRDFSPQIGPYTVGMSSGTSGSRGLFVASAQEQAAWAGAILAKALPGALLKKHRVALFLRANNNLYENLGSKRIQFKFFDLINDPDENIRALLDYNPTILAAPPSMLRKICDYNSSASPSPRPHFMRPTLSHEGRGEMSRIFSIAEVLDPMDEAHLSRAFKQPIHQIYQATEGFLGISCKHGSLHLNEDAVYFEKKYLDDEKRRFTPIITDFRRKTQPIIRYELNDILIEKQTPCTCGSAMTALEGIEGRCDDLFKFPSTSGSNTVEVFPDFIRRAIIKASGDIKEYAAIQKSLDEIHIHLSFPLSPRWRGGRRAMESAVLKNIQSLASQQNFEAPYIKFSQTMPHRDRLSKLKRICCDLPR